MTTAINTNHPRMNWAKPEYLKDVSPEECWAKGTLQQRLVLINRMSQEERHRFVNNRSKEERDELVNYIASRAAERVRNYQTTVMEIQDAALSSSTNMILFSGVMDTYITNTIRKIEKYDLAKKMKFKVPRQLKRLKETYAKIQEYLTKVEGKSIITAISCELPYYADECELDVFNNAAQMAISKKWKKQTDELYIKCRRVADQKSELYPDCIAHLYMVYLICQIIDVLTTLNDQRLNDILRRQYYHDKKMFEEDGIKMGTFKDKDFSHGKLFRDLCFVCEDCIEAITGHKVQSDELTTCNKNIKGFIDMAEPDVTFKILQPIVEASAVSYQDFYIAKLVENELNALPHPEEVKRDIRIVMGSNFGWARVVKDCKALARVISSTDIYDIMDDIKAARKHIKTPALNQLQQYILEHSKGTRVINFEPIVNETINNDIYVQIYRKRLD